MTSIATPNNEFRVNTETENTQGYSSVAALSDGGFVVTWTSFGQSGEGTDIYGQLYNASGNPVGNEFQINTYILDNQFHPSVAALEYGGFVVVWHSPQDGDLAGVYGQRYNANGEAIGNEFQINNYTSGFQYRPFVSGLKDGGFVVVWESEENSNSLYDVIGRRYDDNGNPVGSEFRANTYIASQQVSPSSVGLNDGGFLITWNSYLQDGDESGVYGQRYNADGEPDGDEFLINTYTTNAQHGADATALTDGGFVITWASRGQDGSSFGIYGQKYSALGAAVGSEFHINTYTTSDQIYPTVTALDDGGFYVAWSSVFQDGSTWGAYGQHYNAG